MYFLLVNERCSRFCTYFWLRTINLILLKSDDFDKTLRGSFSTYFPLITIYKRLPQVRKKLFANHEYGDMCI
jgi:hypothetical protein